jgi:parvulin-like peptidyl-prolyl isomerase
VLSSSFACAESQEPVLETVIASVDGNPITLFDLSKRISRPLSIQDLTDDRAARSALDSLILEKVLEEEAKQKGIDVPELEVDQYVDEVAKRNNLPREQFISALMQTGSTESKYREQVRLEILKSKVTAASLRGGVAVTDKEVEEYLEKNKEALNQGPTLSLSQIILDSSKISKKEAISKLKKLIKQVENGESFSDLARKYSDGPEAKKDGGSLGAVAEKDLSPIIFDAVFSLDEGEVSDIVISDKGYHIFYVENKNEDEDDIQEKLRLEIREKLAREKLELKIATYVSEELMKLHSVDKKI